MLRLIEIARLRKVLHVNRAWLIVGLRVVVSVRGRLIVIEWMDATVRIAHRRNLVLLLKMLVM